MSKVLVSLNLALVSEQSADSFRRWTEEAAKSAPDDVVRLFARDHTASMMLVLNQDQASQVTAWARTVPHWDEKAPALLFEPIVWQEQTIDGETWWTALDLGVGVVRFEGGWRLEFTPETQRMCKSSFKDDCPDQQQDYADLQEAQDAVLSL